MFFFLLHHTDIQFDIFLKKFYLRQKIINVEDILT